MCSERRPIGRRRTRRPTTAARSSRASSGSDEALAHLSLALGRNIAVAENVWEFVGGELRLVDVVPVAFERLTFDADGKLRMLTEQAPYEGIELPAAQVRRPHAARGCRGIRCAAGCCGPARWRISASTSR